MIRKYIVMMRFGNSETFNLDEQFVNKNHDWSSDLTKANCK